ncbi:MAG: hypothetical protein AAGH64_05030 [Planctomycetota bacterium]
MDDEPRDLPVFALPLGTWLVWGPGAAFVVALVGGGIGYGVGVYDGLSALAGGVAVAGVLLLTALGVQPWVAREARQWTGWLFAAQMGTLVGSVLACVVAWRAVDAEIAPLGFAGAGAFLLGQTAQTLAFATADRAAREAHGERSEGQDA